MSRLASVLMGFLFLFSCSTAFAQTTSVKGWLDVTAFGAIPNDDVDDWQHIQNAADAMNTGTPNGSVLYFPPGEYRVSNTITLGKSGIVAGGGMDRTVIYATQPWVTVFSTSGTSGSVIFRDFKIDAKVTMTGGAGILLNTPTLDGGAQQLARVENVWLHQQYRGIVVMNATYWTIRDTMITASQADGILINVTSNPDAGDNLISGCVIQGGQFTAGQGNGIYVQSSGGQKIIGNKILGHGIGILVQPVSTVALVDILISNNSIENQASFGILWQTPAGSVVNSHLVGNQLSGQKSGAAIAVSGGISGVAINNNQISVNDPGVAGIFAVGTPGRMPERLTITGNNITGNGSSGTIGILGGDIKTAEIHANFVGETDVAVPYSAIGGRISDATFTAAALPSGAANGSFVYCSDCLVAAACGGGGTGSFAKRLNNAWVCQ